MLLTFFHFLLLAWIFESLQICTNSLETLQKSPTQSPLMKKLTLGYHRHILVLLRSVLEFSYIAFRAFICGTFGDLQLTIMHRNHLKLLTHHRNTPFSWENYVWSTHHRVHCGSHSWPMVLRFFHFLLLALIFESLQIRSKSLETLQKSPTQSPLRKKHTLGYHRHILVLLHSILEFSYIAFRDFMCGIFGDLATDHNASKSLETFNTSPKHSVLMRKVSLVFSW